MVSERTLRQCPPDQVAEFVPEEGWNHEVVAGQETSEPLGAGRIFRQHFVRGRRVKGKGQSPQPW